MDDFFQVIFHDTLEPGSEWLDLAPLYLGDVPPGLGTPDFYVTVEKSGQPFLLLNIYSAFFPIPPQQILWQEWLFIGFGETLFVVSLASLQSFTHKVAWYCGYFYPFADYLLVSSAANLLCFDKNARLLWESDEVGMDGVEVQEVTGNIIKGIGEWDPPGGWRPFEVDLITGKILKLL
jgi:hypothetical protein